MYTILRWLSLFRTKPREVGSKVFLFDHEQSYLQAHAASAGRIGAVSPAPILAAQQGLAGSLQEGQVAFIAGSPGRWCTAEGYDIKAGGHCCQLSCGLE